MKRWQVVLAVLPIFMAAPIFSQVPEWSQLAPTCPIPAGNVDILWDWVHHYDDPPHWPMYRVVIDDTLYFMSWVDEGWDAGGYQRACIQVTPGHHKFYLQALGGEGYGLVLSTSPVWSLEAESPSDVGALKTASPQIFGLYQNYPNPFNPSTSITFSLPAAGHVTLKIFDLLGQEVATLVNGRRQAGTYVELFAPASLVSGTYFYILQAGDLRQVKRMILIR